MNTDILVATYTSHNAAEDGLKLLERNGVDLRNISIVGRDYHSEEWPLGYFNLGERVRFFGKLGAFWGTLAGVLFGAFVMVIPLLGHIIILGPLAATIVSAAEGAAIGAGSGALIGGLTAIGVPRDSAVRYDVQVKADNFLLLVHSTEAEIGRARDLLATTPAETLETHEQAKADEQRVAPVA
jgi:uncharacterized membrane protein